MQLYRFLLPTLAACADVAVSSDTHALEGDDLRVVRVPGELGDQLEVSNADGVRVHAMRTGGELVAVVPVGQEDRLVVAVRDANGELLDRGELATARPDGFVLERLDSKLDVTVSNFAVTYERFDHEAEGEVLRMRASVTTPRGEPIDPSALGDIRWHVDAGEVLTDPRDIFALHLRMPPDRGPKLTLCMFDDVCWDNSIALANRAAVIRRTGIVQTPIDLATLPSSRDFTLQVRFLAQYPRADEQVIVSNGRSGEEEFTIAIGGHHASGLGDSRVFIVVRMYDRQAVYEVPQAPPPHAWDEPYAAPALEKLHWRHVLVSSFDDHVDVFIDGVQQPLHPLITPLRGMVGTLKLGDRPLPNQYARQFYGLVDDLAISSPALTSAQALAQAGGARLGSVPNQIARVDFDSPWTTAQPTGESWTAPTSHTRDDELDRAVLPLPYQVADIEVPFAEGDVWHVQQEFAADVSHRDRSAFAIDLFRVDPRAVRRAANGEQINWFLNVSAGGAVVAPTDAIVAEEPEEQGGEGTIVLSLDATEYVAFMHLDPTSFQVANGNHVRGGDLIALDGDVGAHLHIGFHGPDVLSSPIHGNLTVPMAFSNYERSRDHGRSWELVTRGVPRAGEWLRKPTGPRPK